MGVPMWSRRSLRRLRLVIVVLGRHDRRRRLALLVGIPIVCTIGVLAWVALAGGGGEPDAGDKGTDNDPWTTASPAVRPTKAVHFTEGCVSPECHASYHSAAFVHAPVRERSCETCHSEDAGGHVYPLRSEVDLLCRGCHQVDGVKAYQHGLVSGEGCTPCHDPHASEMRFLLHQPAVAGICERCHLPAQGLFRHEPYEKGECEACHESHESDWPLLLTSGEGIESCRACHADLVEVFESAERSHMRVEGTCLGCHGVHATDFGGHLIAPAAELCLSCHKDIKTQVDNASVSHGAAVTGDRCLSCHDPHASDRIMMLRTDLAHICLECHGKSVEAFDGRTIPDMTRMIEGQVFEHGPVEAGDCAACHNIHGAQHARLLRKPAPAVLLGRFDIRNYALCFDCHTSALVLDERTTTSTQFRQGDRNLHYLHLKKDRNQRTCTSCHAVHGSSQPRHMADHVSFEGSSWRMPIGFVLREDGGSCAPGCHEVLTYTR